MRLGKHRTKKGKGAEKEYLKKEKGRKTGVYSDEEGFFHEISKDHSGTGPVEDTMDEER